MNWSETTLQKKSMSDRRSIGVDMFIVSFGNVWSVGKTVDGKFVVRENINRVKAAMTIKEFNLTGRQSDLLKSERAYRTPLSWERIDEFLSH